AWREGELVIVEVADDGRGVDPQTIRRLAVTRGLASQDMVDTLDDAEAAELIFAPGFTTASSITELSGRGVGMNAVRSALQRMGGHVSLANMPGRGLTVRMTMPFTVMMTRIITLEAGGQVFGLPFDRVIETTRIPREQMKPLGAGQAFVLRDTTIPVISLAERLDLHPGIVPGHHPACLVIASVAGQRVGIEVDRLGEQLDLMLKPVEGLLSSMRAISGTSLLGDGRVLIVLDLEVLLS
ncbi:MAG: chemotaxis protein CheA, partial [Burkholderiales bacterium]